ncbi:hypothetical protein QYM36_006503, partial [Artemia franciscana]
MHIFIFWVQHILSDQWDVILECKVCRNQFRGMANFTCHQPYCKIYYPEPSQRLSDEATSSTSVPTASVKNKKIRIVEKPLEKRDVPVEGQTSRRSLVFKPAINYTESIQEVFKNIQKDLANGNSMRLVNSVKLVFQSFNGANINEDVEISGRKPKCTKYQWDVILECKVCRNQFRGMANFTCHQPYCKIYYPEPSQRLSDEATSSTSVPTASVKNKKIRIVEKPLEKRDVPVEGQTSRRSLVFKPAINYTESIQEVFKNIQKDLANGNSMRLVNSVKLVFQSFNGANINEDVEISGRKPECTKYQWDVILECKVCRNQFRGMANFTCHQPYCKIYYPEPSQRLSDEATSSTSVPTASVKNKKIRIVEKPLEKRDVPVEGQTSRRSLVFKPAINYTESIQEVFKNIQKDLANGNSMRLVNSVKLVFQSFNGANINEDVEISGRKPECTK